ncbi:GDP-mannose 4,6-dehydratase [Prevotella sp. A2931]|uniref:GDP-mannose 4,6-dehydratase n=1 Tax=Prevotella illustrans TaxID=2800387 RepID=A0ABS3M6N2_9BACT|nr:MULTISPECIES: NAD-dependent epimerase/dehydratase family protein [Prevotella]MBO1363825.1 GDP-mannose 4,6-dehydratase [Prevotella illustrans]PTL27089.1 NAD-dependent epimerase [Prevotella sp. oral taxon 820]
MKILITGTAGFIGHGLVKALAREGADIVGIDNINDYYSQELKYARLADTGIAKEDADYGLLTQSRQLPNYRFGKIDLTDRERLDELFAKENFTHVCNLAGQAGVRYSIEAPYSYIQSNVVGFLNILEGCRNHHVSRLVYASSSSIYGMSPHVPFHEADATDQPVSLYAATKKSNELMAYAYSKLYRIPTVSLRFFTVYGPWGRPDMAPMKFMKAIDKGETIQIYNHGNMLRDFTYIDDIVEGVCRILNGHDDRDIPYSVYNIGNSDPVRLLDFIETMEKVMGKEARKEMLDMQPGDVTQTFADTTRLQNDFGYKPSTAIADGLRKLYDWFGEWSTSY